MNNIHSLTTEEVHEIARLAGRLESAQSNVSDAFMRLELLRKRKAVGDTWTVTLELEKSGHSYNRNEVKFRIPFQMVEQQLVDVLNAAKRKLAQLDVQGKIK